MCFIYCELSQYINSFIPWKTQNDRSETYYLRSGSEIRFGSALKIGYTGCPNPNPDSKILDPSKPNPDILIFMSEYLDLYF